MAYAELKNAEGYLQWFKDPLNVQAKADAEATATAWIDSRFHAWQRALWTGANVPPEIRSIALKLASASYLLADIMAGGPTATEEALGMYRTLRREAEEMTSDVLGRGYIVGADGEQQYPDAPGTNFATARNVPLTR